MPRNLEFRVVEAADLPRLHEIRIAAFTPIHDGYREQIGQEMFEIHYRDWQARQGDLLDQICAPNSGHVVYVALEDGEIVGFVGISADVARERGELGLNAVDPRRQGIGIGAAMHEFALAKLKQVGVKMVLVGTGGDAAHLPARRAYAKAGFAANIPGIYYFKLLS
jgi:GNAT superfamily N-acetyltransferase